MSNKFFVLPLIGLLSTGTCLATNNDLTDEELALIASMSVEQPQRNASELDQALIASLMDVVPQPTAVDDLAQAMEASRAQKAIEDQRTQALALAEQEAIRKAAEESELAQVLALSKATAKPEPIDEEEALIARVMAESARMAQTVVQPRNEEEELVARIMAESALEAKRDQEAKLARSLEEALLTVRLPSPDKNAREQDAPKQPIAESNNSPVAKAPAQKSNNSPVAKAPASKNINSPVAKAPVAKSQVAKSPVPKPPLAKAKKVDSSVPAPAGINHHGPVSDGVKSKIAQLTGAADKAGKAKITDVVYTVEYAGIAEPKEIIEVKKRPAQARIVEVKPLADATPIKLGRLVRRSEVKAPKSPLEQSSDDLSDDAELASNNSPMPLAAAEVIQPIRQYGIGDMNSLIVDMDRTIEQIDVVIQEFPGTYEDLNAEVEDLLKKKKALAPAQDQDLETTLVEKTRTMTSWFLLEKRAETMEAQKEELNRVGNEITALEQQMRDVDGQIEVIGSEMREIPGTLKELLTEVKALGDSVPDEKRKNMFKLIKLDSKLHPLNKTKADLRNRLDSAKAELKRYIDEAAATMQLAMTKATESKK
jgi:hypothetical protein